MKVVELKTAQLICALENDFELYMPLVLVFKALKLEMLNYLPQLLIFGKKNQLKSFDFRKKQKIIKLATPQISLS